MEAGSLTFNVVPDGEEAQVGEMAAHVAEIGKDDAVAQASNHVEV